MDARIAANQVAKFKSATEIPGQLAAKKRIEKSVNVGRMIDSLLRCGGSHDELHPRPEQGPWSRPRQHRYGDAKRRVRARAADAPVTKLLHYRDSQSGILIALVSL